MALKRALPFFVILLALTGCFQQAADTFDTVDSSSNSNTDTQIINPTPTEESAITIIAPGMDDLTPETTATEIQSASLEDEATEIPPTLIPTATNQLPPTADSSSVEVVPTATTGSTFVTPEPVIVNEISTVTPTVATTRNPALQPTPSDEVAGVAEVSECVHIVQGGENTFRIALNNNVTLEDLLAVNDLPPDPIIQPGQELIIPGCEEGASAEAESTEEVIAEATAESGEVLADGYRLHIVAAGETLLTIARQYDVTVNDIISENPDLSNPNVIAQGQELLIPPASD